MSNQTLPCSSLLLLGLVAANQSSAEGVDWRCERPAHYFPPVGCMLTGENYDEGLCTSYLATGNWHCLTGWTPSPRGGEYYDHEMAIKAQPALSLPLPSEFALRGHDDSGRSLRLALDTRVLGRAAGRSLPVLELQAMDAKRSGLSLHIERDGHGGFEIVARALGEARPLARLPLAQGRSSVLVDWRVDELNGPQLRLSSGLQGVEIGLPALDAQTRLQLWKSQGVELHFDVSARKPEGSDAGLAPEPRLR